MSTVVNVHEAKTHLSRLLEDVAAGADVVIARAGKPVARLVPIERLPKPKQLGQLRGRIKVPADFNAPLPADVLVDFEGR
jgi:prevent-host-death family protein